jgi:hypothetical protein
LVAALLVSTVFGAYLTYKGFVEIYGTKYPLGIVELETHGLNPIEGLEAGEQHIGEIRVWTYSNDSEMILQLMQVSQIVTNFRSFTVKVALPLKIIFVVDVTGSMGLYIDTVKAKLIELMGVLDAMNPCPVEVGVVAFMDYEPQTTSIALTDNYAAVETFINGLTAGGGAGIPQSHYLGFEKALELFHRNEGWLTYDRAVVFVSDAQAGYNDLPEWPHAEAAAWALADEGVKIHSVLCGPEEEPELSELQYYSAISAGNFIVGADRIVPGVTRDPTWIVKLTPITPFDSFRMKLASSPPTEKKGYYSFQIWVDYFCKAVPWHEYFMCELSAHLEHAELPPYTPPTPPTKVVPPIEITLGCSPISVKVGSSITFTWTIPAVAGFTPTSVKLYWQDPTTPAPGTLLYTGTSFPTDYTGSKTYTATVPAGTWFVWLYYTFEWADPEYTTGAFAMFTVTP